MLRVIVDYKGAGRSWRGESFKQHCAEATRCLAFALEREGLSLRTMKVWFYPSSIMFRVACRDRKGAFYFNWEIGSFFLKQLVPAGRRKWRCVATIPLETIDGAGLGKGLAEAVALATARDEREKGKRRRIAVAA